MNIPTLRARLIEIPLSATAPQGSEFPFPDQPDLRGAEVTGIETFSALDLTAGPNGLPTISAADSLNACLIITEASDEKARFLAYTSCRRALNAGRVREFRDLRPTWDQCRVRIVAALAAATQTSALVLVHYRYPRDPK